MAEIKAVIFDWGGVLIDDPLSGLMQYCADALGVSKEEFIKAYNKSADDFTRGKIGEKTFWNKICGELGKPLPKESSLWGNAFRAVYRPRNEMFSMVSSLRKAGYKTALLSNTEVPPVQLFHEQKYDMFEVLVFSCAEKTAKPERKIYEITVQRLGTTPEQIVFIDDRQNFVDGAKQAGLNAILFQGIEQLKKELARFGIT
jgi:epoxide hydrolase-like predicted phosphatase